MHAIGRRARARRGTKAIAVAGAVTATLLATVASALPASARVTSSSRPTYDVHQVLSGDPNPGNIRMTADRVAMIDWDESHVDVPDLDLALPHNAAGLDEDAYDIAAQARAAWGAAVCWDPSGTDQFAVKRLAEVRAV
ncbi:MAG TPA: phosphotransferase [Streptosporangiaceae bacterium]|nr:phosphotransferase [Streptosporangiaceae bacterium]